jgi:thioredoxin
MNRKCKYGFAFLFGWLVYANMACNTSVEAKSEENASVAEMQESVSVQVATAETEQTAIKPVVLSEEQFKQLVVDFTSSNQNFKGEKPCVIDFYADWCRPCKALVPIFEKMAEKYGDEINFYKVNVDDCKKLSAVYNVRAIPTLFFFNKKGTLTQMVGRPSEEEIENAITAIQ